MSRKLFAVTLSALVLASAAAALASPPEDVPRVLGIRERAELVLSITRDRLDRLLPGLMRETGFDMWIIACNEDDLDPVLMTMMPYENWCPITQILVLFDRGPEKGVERVNVSRTDTQGLFENAWDAAAWDAGKSIEMNASDMSNAKTNVKVRRALSSLSTVIYLCLDTGTALMFGIKTLPCPFHDYPTWEPSGKPFYGHP